MNVQGTPNLFPLDLIYSRLKGYYLATVDGKTAHIFSTRGSKKTLSRLSGSKARSWSPRYFTLDNASWSESDLLAKVMAHHDFVKETASVSTVIAPLSRGVNVASLTRNHAANLDAGIKAKGSIIGTVRNGQLSISQTPAVHLTKESLQAEMQRLATANPGVKYVSLTLSSALVAGGLVWE